jgi:Protein of unknown function (DUF3592)
MPEHPLGATVAGLVLFVVGLTIGGGALLADFKEREALAGTVRTEGTVVAQIRQRRANDTVSLPVIAFATQSGERVSFTAHETDPSVYHLGAKLQILYRPDNPSDARLASNRSRRTRNTIAAIATVVLVSLGSYVAWYARRWAATHPTEP